MNDKKPDKKIDKKPDVPRARRPLNVKLGVLVTDKPAPSPPPVIVKEKIRVPPVPFPEEYRHMPARDPDTHRFMWETAEQWWWVWCWTWMMVGNHLLLERTVGRSLKAPLT